MSEDTELLPCPFCGGRVSIDDPDAHKRGVGYRVECETCYLSMWAFARELPASLAYRWNSRALLEGADCEETVDLTGE